MLNKSLAVGIIFFLVVSCVPYSILSNEMSTSMFDGNILYVGGSGHGNYSKIQDAIDNASGGDTVFVYSGTYYENVAVDKSIDLVGEDRNSTIIDGQNKHRVITVLAESVLIEKFTIRNGSYGVDGCYWNVIISDNIIVNNDRGITVTESDNYNITGNIITENNYGISFYAVSNSSIKYNLIMLNKKTGIYLTWSAFYGSYYNSIYYNTIQKNKKGIHLDMSGFNKINYNNFYQNNGDASISMDPSNSWNHNYWDRSRILPKPIIGWGLLWIFPFINFDWHPAQEPYDIP